MPLSQLDETFAEKRRYRRQPVRFSGLLHQDGIATGCIVEDISAGGAQIVTERPVDLAREITLDLSYAGQFTGRMAWAKASRAGVYFQQDATTVADRIRSAWGLLI
jgi:hypothetical protein